MNNEIIWHDETMTGVFETLARRIPLPFPLVVLKRDPIDGFAPGSWFDGEKMIAEYTNMMPIGIVQLHILGAYGIAVGFSDGAPPNTTEARQDYHEALLSVFFEVSKFNPRLADAYKEHCIPKAMQYLATLHERIENAGEMN